MECFQKDLNDFGLLKWKINEPSFTVNFLDLTLKIEAGKITSKTYQKPTNLYQYTSNNSAHPARMIRGIIYSMLKRYYQQNTSEDDYWKVAMAFYNHLKYRGWNRKTLEKYFVASHNRLTGTNFKKLLTVIHLFQTRKQPSYILNITNMTSQEKK